MVITDCASINNDTTELEEFLAENANPMINGERVFNQWTGKETDTCEYKQLLNLATKPMKYYVNSLNNISGISNDNNQDENFLSFTPIGNAACVNIPNFYDRAIPSRLNSLSSIYTLPYSTSPDLQMTNNTSRLDTDVDLNLKTTAGFIGKIGKTVGETKHHMIDEDNADNIENNIMKFDKSSVSKSNVSGLKCYVDIDQGASIGGISSRGISQNIATLKNRKN